MLAISIGAMGGVALLGWVENDVRLRLKATTLATHPFAIVAPIVMTVACPGRQAREAQPVTVGAEGSALRIIPPFQAAQWVGVAVVTR
jgi:hypothetical protein